MKQNQLIIMFLVAVVMAGTGFFAGTKYQESKTPTFSRQFGNGMQNPSGIGANGRGAAGTAGGARTGARQVVGDIIKSDDTSITVKMSDGSTRIVFVNDKTMINKASSAMKTDLTVGEKVAAFGTDNPDGSMNAANVQLNPIARNQGVGTSAAGNSVK